VEEHHLYLNNATITKNYSNSNKKSYIYLYISSSIDLSFVNGFENILKKELIFISSSNEVFEILTNLNRKAVYLSPFKPLNGISRYSLFRRLFQRWKYNKSILIMLNNEIKEDDEFMFYLLIIEYWGTMIAKYLSINNNNLVTYIKQPKKYVDYNKFIKFDIKYFYNQFMDSVTYQLSLHWFRFNNGLGHYLGVGDFFLSKYNIKIATNYDNVFFNPEKIVSTNTKNIKIINQLIIGGYSIDGAKEFYEIKDLIDIYYVIKENCPDAFHKYHPGKFIKDELSDSFFQIDPRLPIEYSGYKIKVAISDFSNALILLSSQGTICVSYLKLVRISENFDLNSVIDDLSIKSDNKILFPETIDEFIKLIK